MEDKNKTPDEPVTDAEESTSQETETESGWPVAAGSGGSEDHTPEVPEEQDGPSDTRLWIWTLAGIYCIYNAIRLIREYSGIDNARERYVVLLAIVLFFGFGAWAIVRFGVKAWKRQEARSREMRESRKKELEERKAKLNEPKQHIRFDNSAAAEETEDDAPDNGAAAEETEDDTPDNSAAAEETEDDASDDGNA